MLSKKKSLKKDTAISLLMHEHSRSYVIAGSKLFKTYPELATRLSYGIDRRIYH